jgi:hypothetical protein
MPKTVEELQSEVDTLTGQLTEARGRITELNKESQGHRLAAGNATTKVEGLEGQVAALTTKLAETTTAHTTALDTLRSEHTSAMDGLRAEHTATLDSLRTDLTGKVTEAEGKATDAAGKAKARATQADLRIAAKEAGMVDLDGLKLLDQAAVKTDDDGNVTNAAELMAAMKTAKPFMFGTGSTSNTSQTPLPNKEGAPKSALDMTADEYKAARAIAASGKLPAVAAAAA